MALLSSRSRIRGSTKASASARRSRTSWINSLRACEMIRRISILRSYLSFLPGLFDDGDEHVFERVTFFVDIADFEARITQQANDLLLAGRHVFAGNDVEAVAKQRHTPAVHMFFKEVGGALRLIHAQFQEVTMLRGFDGARR